MGLILSEPSDERIVIQGFIYCAQERSCLREKTMEKLEIVKNHTKELEEKISKIENQNSEEYKDFIKELDSWSCLQAPLEKILDKQKNFDKILFLSNLRHLIQQNPNIKIGKIEKEAGVQLGYVSRLEKDGSTADPSAEFILTSAKLLGVGVDVLVSCDMQKLTSMEVYLISFFDKLKIDTLAGILSWQMKTESELNEIKPTDDNRIHPLFIKQNKENGRENEYVFNSKTFGNNTRISDDCFSLVLKKDAIIHLMAVQNKSAQIGEQDVIEAWMEVSDNRKSSMIASSYEESAISPILLNLYKVIKEQIRQPQFDTDVMAAIDFFMNGSNEE